MFLNPAFLIAASLIVLFEAVVLTFLYYLIKGKVTVPVDAPASFIWKLEFEQKVARILFPVLLVGSLVVDVSALSAYAKSSNEKLAEAEISEALKLVLSKAVSLKRDRMCTINGFIAGPDTTEQNKVACAQIGDFRVFNQAVDRSYAYIFKVKSENEVVQVTRNAYSGLSIIDGETTVDELKTAFSVK